MHTFFDQVHNVGDRMQVIWQDMDGIMLTGNHWLLQCRHIDMWGKESIMEKKKGMNEETKGQEAEELAFDDLDQVAGGYSLRDAKKEKTTDISAGTISKI